MKQLEKEKAGYLMKPFKCLLALLIMVNVCWAGEISVKIEPLTDSDFIELKKSTPSAIRDAYRLLYIKYKDKDSYLFVRIRSLPTSVKYNQLLNCDGVDYPVVMLETDSSYEKASLSVTFLTNRLFIFGDTLKLMKKFESVYLMEENDDGIYLESDHFVTLDNVEKFACDRIKEIK